MDPLHVELPLQLNLEACGHVLIEAGRPAPLRRPDSEDGDGDSDDGKDAPTTDSSAVAPEAPGKEDAAGSMAVNEAADMAVAAPVSSDTEMPLVEEASAGQVVSMATEQSVELATAGDNDEDDEDMAAIFDCLLFDIKPEET